jgi:hypothetical protein
MFHHRTLGRPMSYPHGQEVCGIRLRNTKEAFVFVGAYGATRLTPKLRKKSGAWKKVPGVGSWVKQQGGAPREHFGLDPPGA